MDKEKILLDSTQIGLILHRLVCEILEDYEETSELVLIGLQPRGIHVAERLSQIINHEYKINIPLGHLDITFFRDDFGVKGTNISASKTKINFLVQDKKVILIDDVLFTGRSIRAALTALQTFGRPKSIKLLTLIDRRFNRELPIQPDYYGRRVDVISTENVRVDWGSNDTENNVYIVSN